MNRSDSLDNLNKVSQWDIIIIGGGASGLGIAVDASKRGYRTLLLEKYDFGKGTSSRSTKLIHGCLLYTSPSPRDMRRSRMPSSA